MAVQIEHYRDMGAFDYGAVMRMTPLIRKRLGGSLHFSVA